MNNIELNEVFDKIIKTLSESLVRIKSKHASDLLSGHAKDEGIDSMFINDGLYMIGEYDDVYHIDKLIDEVISLKAKEYFKYIESIKAEGER